MAEVTLKATPKPEPFTRLGVSATPNKSDADPTVLELLTPTLLVIGVPVGMPAVVVRYTLTAEGVAAPCVLYPDPMNVTMTPSMVASDGIVKGNPNTYPALTPESEVTTEVGI